MTDPLKLAEEAKRLLRAAVDAAADDDDTVHVLGPQCEASIEALAALASSQQEEDAMDAKALLAAYQSGRADERAALAPDAARYRWLRERWVEFHDELQPAPFADRFRARRGELDAAIDAERAGKGED